MCLSSTNSRVPSFVLVCNSNDGCGFRWGTIQTKCNNRDIGDDQSLSETVKIEIVAPVTIGITTYNSATTVIDTLESIFLQSYLPLHLIISDDASQDETVAIATAWLDRSSHRSRFLSVQLITVPQNTGVSANCNRVIAAAPTDWIKFIAGDDILLSECIRLNMEYVAQVPESRVVFSQVQLFADEFNPQNMLRTTPALFPDNLMHPSFTAYDQWRILLESDRINYTPSYFFNKEAIVDVGGYDEENRLQEDYPMWLKLTLSGYRLFYFHSPTVGYRQHAGALINTHGEALFKPLTLKAYYVRKQYCHPYLPFTRRRQENWAYWVRRLFHAMRWDVHATPLKQKALRLLEVYLNPWFYIDALQRRLPYVLIL